MKRKIYDSMQKWKEEYNGLINQDTEHDIS